ncbi:hypothetical protein [Sunxiuqinia dokdonensis]|uniref:Uncharacterized protein n=1 Tax=Sunxiuqinia dokdonensis TaxID=1409788 RepID=A0A0L8V4X4_9BACT|nr:hypothetical protein [Sunxiuqinia dokdonensis]KOH43491.1 hypothetical protein NC99_36760 [Sunxiuqinia dokdonensis]
MAGLPQRCNTEEIFFDGLPQPCNMQKMLWLACRSRATKQKFLWLASRRRAARQQIRWLASRRLAAWQSKGMLINPGGPATIRIDTTMIGSPKAVQSTGADPGRKTSSR